MTSVPQPTDEPTVRLIERVGPNHLPGFEHLAGLNLSARQGDTFEYFRVDFELNCGSASFQVENGIMQVSLRTCHVQLRRDNCDVVPATAYEFFIGEAEVDRRSTHTASSDLTGMVEGEVGASLDQSMVPSGMAKGRASGSARQTLATQTSVTVRTRSDLIVTSGQDRWRVGDPVTGDPRRLDKRLTGSYFVERTRSGGEPVPLCALKRRQANSDAIVTICVSAPLGQMIVEDQGNANKSADRRSRSHVEDNLTAGSRAVNVSHTKELLPLRARVAGLVLGKNLRKRQIESELAPPSGEVLISATSLVVRDSTRIQDLE